MIILMKTMTAAPSVRDSEEVSAHMALVVKSPLKVGNASIVIQRDARSSVDMDQMQEKVVTEEENVTYYIPSSVDIQ